MLSDTLNKMQNLNNKLNSSLLLQSMFDIDWSKGKPTRYSQTKYIDGKQQTYKSWIQQGALEINLNPEQYQKLSGIELNREQIKNWSTK